MQWHTGIGFQEDKARIIMFSLTCELKQIAKVNSSFEINSNTN